MLAALLLNLGSAPPSKPPARRGFGGGPFWRQYGYDKSYTQTSTALPATPAPVLSAESFAPINKGFGGAAAAINYRLINTRVAEEVAKDMQALREKVTEENEDELIRIFLLLGE